MPPRRHDPWINAVSHLILTDPKWQPIIEQVGPCLLRPRRDRFGTLVRAIIGQQISSKAAQSIDARLRSLAGATHTPEGLLSLGEIGIRQAGLSGVKARYVLNLAESVHSGAVPLNRIGRFGDNEIVERLTTIKGVGRWTAEMFLIFALNRPDVLPLADLGLRVGLKQHYGLDQNPAPPECIRLAEPWRPYRSIAMWYLWRAIPLRAR